MSDKNKILIIDDNEVERELSRMMLEKNGYLVVEQSSAISCLQTIAEEKPNLVLLDIMMPDMDGNQALQMIRSKYSALELPIVMVTSKSDATDVVESLKFGASDYITKPLQFDVALRRIQTHLTIGLQSATLRELNENLESRVKEQASKLVGAEKMKALGEMTAGIAHEINSPLSVITVYSNNLLKSAQQGFLDSDEVTKMSSSMVKNAEQIARIVRGIKTYSRKDDSDPMESVQVARLIENVSELCKSDYKKNAIDLKVTGNTDVQLMCRPGQILQVLLNLANNAHDAIVSLGNEERWVEFNITEKENWMLISVTDSGHGISKEVVQKLMQPFFTTKESGKGTGLGLSISKTLIESHGGTFEYDKNSPNTRFLIRLPKR